MSGPSDTHIGPLVCAAGTTCLSDAVPHGQNRQLLVWIGECRVGVVDTGGLIT
jgi:hypothetical protein